MKERGLNTAENVSEPMSQQEREGESEWDDIVAEIIDEDRDLLDALAD